MNQNLGLILRSTAIINLGMFGRSGNASLHNLASRVANKFTAQLAIIRLLALT